MKILILLLFSFPCLAQNQDWDAYKKAVQRAFHFKKLKRPSVLFNVNETNSLLHISCNPSFKCTRDKGNWVKNKDVRVKMVSWVSSRTADRFFSSYAGKAKPYNTGNKFLWVSAYPQLQNFCQKSKTEDIRLRLRQYMGLPPDANKTHFVHVWVKPTDLFRPCYDEEITDVKCGYTFPQDISSKHNKWLRDQLIAAYPKNGTKYPWTRLGYTYDWGNPKSYFGATEYVVKANANIYIESITPTEVYCKK